MLPLLRASRVLSSRRWLALLGGLVIACVSQGCSDLPDVSRNTCGNAVIESGEDCDGFEPKGASCGTPSSSTPCRFVCSAKATCPEGMACGLDSVCRAASGKLDELGAPFDAFAARLSLADFDGDGRSDLLSMPATTLGISAGPQLTYFNTRGEILSTYSLPPLVSTPTLGNLDGNTRVDISFTSGGALGVALGQSDRSATFVGYSQYAIPSTTPLLVQPIPFDEPGCLQGRKFCREIALFTVGTNGVIQLIIPDDSASASGGNAVQLVTVNDGLWQGGTPTLDQLAGPIVSGPLIKDDNPGHPSTFTDCHELVYGLQNQPGVYVASPCTWTEEFDLNLNTAGTPIQIRLPADVTVQTGVAIADVDGDGNNDVMIGTYDGSYVSFGDSHGGFTSLPGGAGVANRTTRWAIAVIGADGSTTPTYPCSDGTPGNCLPLPLAFGDLNGDGISDFISDSGIFVSARVNGQIFFTPTTLTAQSYWTTARVADINGDGQPDVIAGSAYDRSIDVLIGSGDGRFALASLPTTGTVTRMVTGDFDGDLVGDIAFTELLPSENTSQTTSTTIDEYSLSISFGRKASTPLAPISVGLYERVEQLIKSDFGSLSLSTDSIDDIGIMSLPSDSDLRNIGLLLGSTDRQPVALFGLASNTGGALSRGAAMTSAAGKFTTDSLDGIVAVAFDANGSAASPVRFWLTRATGRARLGTATASEPIEPSLLGDADIFNSIVGGRGRLLLKGDVNGDGRDEAILLFWGDKEGKTTRVVIADTVEKSGAFAFKTRSATTLAKGLSYDAAAELVDLDGDGHQDLVLLTTIAGSLSPLVGDPASGVGTGDDVPTPGDYGAPNLFVLWNDGKGAFDVDNPLQLVEQDAPASSFAILRHGVDRPQILVVSNGELSRRAGTKKHPRTLDTSALPISFLGMQSVAAGDVDGDGVDDVVVDDGFRAQLFSSRPKIK